MARDKDPYIVLGIPRNADPCDVKRAYRRLVLMLHPDLTGNPSGAQRLAEAHDAYQALTDADVRHAPEAISARPADPTAPADPATPPPRVDVFPYSDWRHAVRFRPIPYASASAAHLADQVRDLFTQVDEMMGGVVPELLPGRPPNVPKDLYVEVVLTRDEAANGGVFPLSVPVRIPCRACLGSGLGEISSRCSRCAGQGFTQERKELELVVPPHVSDGQDVKLRLGDSGPAPVLHVFVRIA